MSPTKAPELELAPFLKSALPQENRASLRDSVIPQLLSAIADIGKGLRGSYDVSIVGTENAFGDEQLNVDVLAENIIQDPVEKPARAGETTQADSSAEQYTVAFDPLDGSSIIGPNWSVGTIVGIWDGVTAVGQPTEKQIASVLGVFGPRTLAIIALRVPGSKPVCFEVSLNDTQKFVVARPELRLAEPPFKTRYFAPANLRAAAENEKYMNLVTKFITDKYTLRYSGGLIPDIYHALVKGHGVYISPVTSASKAKLRRLYELLPVALVVECAGGQAIDPETGARVFDTILKGCDDRAGLVCGTSEEVEKVKKALLG
ncbi:hypothetical protein AU210_015149 [Fusarium oxysporum f. sp. radicis-cucumerinum]|uniref:Sedoheptulose-1,7-bisphosphatase n=1 Tax=Fusarium oxysporum f. sp. radicis-cucumerinum TaxID=327505 RepID=A0A2H3GGR8_FUSOX|nr:hypothetical protein AU210_015149 [Fusarium oxysporum f. sp. radicis-cucumerinum]